MTALQYDDVALVFGGSGNFEVIHDKIITGYIYTMN
jgi:hypothetical protein